MSSIKKYALQSTGILHLRDGNEELMYADNVDGQPDLNRPMRAHLFGPGTKVYAAAKAQAQNRAMDRLKKKGKSDMTAEDQAKETAQFLAACTKELENVEYDGLTGRDLHIAIYTDLELCFVPAQIDKWLADTANFTKASPTT
ncbi:hypothetical protein UNDYM_1661 [Undibacterium sp. YM2]|uniref:hypothetical protein n=1 Tax=Undibacterium sp. YM2 TaxID=2058625 RepID=UPI001331EE8C|nr:hypothetical protein [Undibacterium sp. YM2]BBB65914.1 hypothetical protein UNDYM_1661 [Undibacterium sp. YM2]